MVHLQQDFKLSIYPISLISRQQCSSVGECWAHNPKVRRSKRRTARFLSAARTSLLPDVKRRKNRFAYGESASVAFTLMSSLGQDRLSRTETPSSKRTLGMAHRKQTPLILSLRKKAEAVLIRGH
eukprot:Protomagalhaensia_sp_Gyna_25__454@NODE_1214_length_2062_cov_104_236283_g966_i0_p2_GENE_NODE_1214_length_2062_cov_104_236283_g966_i0NODE_1214_length_2062_cov_104_236283_g966_i0_p2_ORF_typecomplete_len125_score7_56_NODE_1214_length_2062_cov_104_236283_g966_i014831857